MDLDYPNSLLYEHNTIAVVNPSWDTSTSSQVSNFDDAVLEIYMVNKFQWPSKCLKNKPLLSDVVT